MSQNVDTWTQCLPAFYAILDTVAIPTGENIALQPVRLALLSLQALRMLDESHLKVGVDLWPRIYQWISFVHTYRECLPPIPVDQDIYAALLFFIQHLGRD